VLSRRRIAGKYPCRKKSPGKKEGNAKEGLPWQVDFNTKLQSYIEQNFAEAYKFTRELSQTDAGFRRDIQQDGIGRD
jgi:hypothetical protein